MPEPGKPQPRVMSDVDIAQQAAGQAALAGRRTPPAPAAGQHGDSPVYVPSALYAKWEEADHA